MEQPITHHRISLYIALIAMPGGHKGCFMEIFANSDEEADRQHKDSFFESEMCPDWNLVHIYKVQDLNDWNRLADQMSRHGYVFNIDTYTSLKDHTECGVGNSYFQVPELVKRTHYPHNKTTYNPATKQDEPHV